VGVEMKQKNENGAVVPAGTGQREPVGRPTDE
jgi:hypothetical protein